MTNTVNPDQEQSNVVPQCLLPGSLLFSPILKVVRNVSAETTLALDISDAFLAI